MMLHRRAFFGGLIASIAAPAIVRATSIMPVRGIIMPVVPDIGGFRVPPEFIHSIHQLLDAGIVLRREVRVSMGIDTGIGWIDEPERPRIQGAA